jgi:23S rRNA (adenine2503-C2)-methyltransferase
MKKMQKKIIKDLNLAEAEEFFLSIEEKKYRGKQLFNWIYERNIDSFDLMTNFSKSLRALLSEKFILNPLELIDRRISKIDGTEKYLFKTYDNHFIESVLLKNYTDDKERLTVCISSQVGCGMGCVFCETGKLGFTRNLGTGEIIDQICQVRRISGVKNNNVVFMGMGEPFMNYDNTVRSADIMNYTFGFHISIRKITISTSGLKDKIERYISENRPYNLALSLNDNEREKRIKTMPVEKNNPFSEIITMFRKKLPVAKNRLNIEYVMRKDNIFIHDATRIRKLLEGMKIRLNLIPLNAGDHDLESPDQKSMDLFIDELRKMNIPVTVRKSLGSDIFGACGQLSGREYKKTGIK